MDLDILSLRGVPTQVLRQPAPPSSTSPTSSADQLLLIPGNPGLIALYQPFAARLAALGGGAWSVAGAAHAGHAPGHPAPGGPRAWFTLADQVAHHRAFLDALPAGGRVHVVGHSIGAWLGLHLYDALPPVRRGRLVMLMPTLEGMARTPNGLRIAPMLRPTGQRMAAGVLAGLRALPLAVRRPLAARLYLHAAPEADRAALSAGLLGLEGAGLAQVLRLADEELRTVVVLPTALLEAHAARLAVGLADGDGWNLPGVAERFPAAATVWRAPAGTLHAFLFGAQVEAVAAWVAGVLRD